MKYEIKVTQINDDGSRKPFFFDQDNQHDTITSDGFAIIGVNDDGSESCAIHDTDLLRLGCAIVENEELDKAARIGMCISGIMRGDKDAAK